MDTLYTFGPSVLGLVAALTIALYCWNRLRIATVILVGWITISLAVGQIPFFQGFPDWQESDWQGFNIFGTLAFAPAALLVIAALRVKRVKEALDKIPTSAFVVTQAYRFGGAFLIVAYLRGELPAEIGLVSGILDVIVATTAILLTFYLRGNESRSPRLVMAWAILALADFAWASMMLTLSFLGVLELSPAPVMMGNPPLLIISLFALPFGIFVSVYLIMRMRKVLSRRVSL
ncbi:MAG: hypothetical protein F2621_04295 [Actinobacteria bacterium]|uniref:Unannotated protein n=1 Tax=freshwater metagenome TaxID=449393 RepID=A0A6J6EP60_9ZZZZ|nr:hypothetical protein [Actinomycetota bacterium]MTA33385.1 hypothetical protein [Actinomycetota bacterium]